MTRPERKTKRYFCSSRPGARNRTDLTGLEVPFPHGFWFVINERSARLPFDCALPRLRFEVHIFGNPQGRCQKRNTRDGTPRNHETTSRSFSKSTPTSVIAFVPAKKRCPTLRMRRLSMSCDVSLVGLNPARSGTASFWSYWFSGYGFDKKKMVC
jgi:hypothetical protein